MSHQNVFTLIKSDGCGFCKQLMANWSDIEKKLKLIDPNVLIEVITMDKSLKLDNDKYPKHLTIYAKWFPMIIAMPYNLWDWGIQNNNTNIDINFKEGVNIFNGVWKNETLEYVQNFSIKKNPQDVIAKWFADSLVNQDFINIKNKSFKSDNKLIKSIINPKTQPKTPPKNNQKNKINKQNNNDNNDICNLRIISRTK